MAPSRANSQPALVVLGCALRRVGASGPRGVAIGGALGRRVLRAAWEWGRATSEDADGDRPGVLIASGGRCWSGEMEADGMAEALVALGVPGGLVVRERTSLHTRDNARYTAAICGRRGIGRITLVTCGWHLARARMAFEAEGLQVSREVSAGDGNFGWVERAWVHGKERAFIALAARAR